MSLLGQRPKMILDGVAARACRFGHIHHRDAPALTRQFNQGMGTLHQCVCLTRGVRNQLLGLSRGTVVLIFKPDSHVL